MDDLKQRYARDFQPLFEALQRGGHTIEVPRVRQVYCNRDVDLNAIDAIGFDMDYTLIQYHQEAMEALAVQLTLHNLVHTYHYPDDVLNLTPNPQLAARGLVVDRHLGNLLKMDADRRVVQAWHGSTALDDLTSQDYALDATRADPDRFYLVDTLYALPEVSTYAALVDYLDARHAADPSLPSPDYAVTFDHVRACIDLAHRNGSLKGAILNDLDTYIQADPRLGPTLHKFRSAGLRLFIMTNSGWAYTDALMSYLLDHQLPHYTSWRHYFDAVIVAARKPSFFTRDDDAPPFIALDHDGQPLGPCADPLDRGALVQGGNLGALEAQAPWMGRRILYIGDHIYGDVLRSKKLGSWRTCMVVQEMAAELQHADRIRDAISQARNLDTELRRLNEEIAFEQHLIEQLRDLLPNTNSTPTTHHPPTTLDQLHDGLRRLQSSLTAMRRQRTHLIDQLRDLDRIIDRSFNPYWGLLFKAHNERSLFGSQVQRYADLYTSTICNFLAYSPRQYFRAPLATMPHEL